MKTANLVYSIICDDVRIEMGNKLSLMGIFENIFFQAFPSALLKFAIVNHWIGNGQFETHVKILAPDRKELVMNVFESPIRHDDYMITASHLAGEKADDLIS